MNDTAEQIRVRMDSMRDHLSEHVDDVVESAGQIVDWREYVTRYPWACLAATFAVGYLLVPARLEILRPDADALLELAKRKKVVVETAPSPQKHGGVTGMLLSAAANAAVRGVVSYFTQPGTRTPEPSDSDRSPPPAGT
jgi:hypothetical protein